MKRSNQFSNPWTEKEIEFVCDEKLSINEVATITNRSYAAVKAKRMDLNIKGKSEIDYWSEKEIIFLTKNRLLSNAEISEQIGRSENAVSLKRNKLGVPQISKNYDEFEIEYLIVNYHEKSVKEISEFLGRSASSIQSKAYELGITKKSEYWSKSEVEFLQKNIKLSNEKLSKSINKSINQIAYKKAHLRSIEIREKNVSDEIEENVPFSTRGKINRYIDVLFVMKIGDSLEFPDNEYQLVIQAKSYLSERLFKTKKDKEGTRRIWRLN
ncbi:hypothetical protein [Chryseobacterium arthrosphaerae]|uniref:hypothetical protein n=1 Tax=Chryseobacterium arthrosphaerae TaxID=651561 RepID=UPI0031D53662